MGNGIENGSSHSQREHSIIPKNGLFKIGDITYRSIDGKLFKVRTGEEVVQQMSEALDKYEGVGRSILQSPFSRVPEGVQRHTRIIPQSPDNI